MDLLTRVVRALLLLALLLAVTPCPGESKELCPHPCRCQRRGLLDCRHAGLATVPPATRRRALTVLDFTGNSIATLAKQAWKEYPWTETLVLRDNELQAVKSHSLEGLFLLKHLDLSGNRILLIEEGAFEPLPFLRLLNLSGNGLTQIHSGTFQAWHGMQFLEELILSHNPLTVIADTAFFKLPSVNYLDLSATQVTPQTLLLLLQTTVHLETLKLPSDVACCLCQEHASTETPCRTIQFLCQNLCSSSSAQCAAHTGPVAQTQGEVMEVEPSRKAKSSPVLNLRAKEPSLGDHGTVTLGVALTLSSTEGDVSSLKDSRANSYPPEHLSRQEGKTVDDDVKNNLHKAKSIMSMKSIVSRQPQPVREKDAEEKSIIVWEQKQKGSHLNWQALNPWDGAGGLNPTDEDSVFGHHKGVDVALSPRQNHIWKKREHKKTDSQYWVGQNLLFYQALGPAKAQGEPRGRESKAQQGLNRNLDFLSDPLVNNGPAAISRVEDRAEGEPSSPGGHFPLLPDTMETSWKEEEEEFRSLNKPRSPEGPDVLPVPEDVFEIMGYHHLVPDEGLQIFLTHVEQALRMDCSRPGLQLSCAKMVSKTELLLSLLSNRQESEGAFDLMGQCPIDENISRRTALEKVKKHRGEKPEPVDDTITLVVLLSVLAVISLTVMCALKLCSRPCAVFCRCLCTVWRSFLVILRRRWRKNKYRKLEDVEDFPELSESDLLVAQYIMDVLDKEEEESRKERQQGNTDASQKKTECQELHLQEGEEEMEEV
ncbi:leucine-rich repeat-containing protein 37A-like isoform X2 [Chiroxiphia lanceolata]|uniref:leucine-rich repeat-containing protein 37A-like isoform X2 n=1 Tax=Chiroxiphia lanceolata TaxID=296741 RepID=UPI0013CEFEAA|nr:leucine-rich repeat-containing protein 37A-like isoform X2 [Chiroxiphia lanceolata]